MGASVGGDCGADGGDDVNNLPAPTPTDAARITGWQPVYELAPPDPTAGMPPAPGRKGIAFEGLDVAILAAGAVLVAVCSWLAAGSYYGARSIERANERADAAIAYAEQLQTMTEQQGAAIEAARAALRCLPTEGP